MTSRRAKCAKQVCAADAEAVACQRPDRTTAIAAATNVKHCLYSAFATNALNTSTNEKGEEEAAYETAAG